jgi:hypothetical protein
MPEASQAEKNMYGADVRLHPITLMPLEYGIGCAPDDVQAQAHCKVIERERGKKIADEYRARLAEAAKNPEAPELTRAKAAADRARSTADATKVAADAAADVATAADAAVAELSKATPKTVTFSPRPTILQTEQDR